MAFGLCLFRSIYQMNRYVMLDVDKLISLLLSSVVTGFELVIFDV